MRRSPKAGDAEYLAAAKREADVGKTVLCGQALDLKDLFAEFDVPFREHFGDVALDHQSRDGGCRRRGDRHRGDVEAVAQHCCLIAQRLDLAEIVEDVYDRHAFVAQSPDQTEENVGLSPDQCRRRFIEDEHLWLVQKRAGDLHDLPFRCRKFSDQHVAGEIHPEIIGQNFARVALHAPAVQKWLVPAIRGSRPRNSASPTVKVGTSSRS